jgi:hypothetical protein
MGSIVAAWEPAGQSVRPMTMTGSIALRRLVAWVTALLALTTAFAGGYLIARDRGDEPSYRLTGAGLDSGLSCERLRQWYVDHGLAQVTAWGWQSPIYRELGPEVAPGAPTDQRGTVPGAAAPLDTATGSSTGTNVQEAGVDEPDVAKVSGDLLVRITEGALKTDDVSGAEPRRLGVAPLDRMGDPQLLLAGHRVLVIGSEIPDPAAGAPLAAPSPRTWVRTYDLTDPSVPTLVDSRLYDGSLVTARQVGTTVRLVLEGGLPSLPFETPSSVDGATGITPAQALAHNRAVVRASTIADWLPEATTYDGGVSRSTSSLVERADVSVPETFDGLGTLSVVGFDPARPDETDAVAVATSSQAAYMSTGHLYVAASPWSPSVQPGGPLVVPDAFGGPTRIYGFDLSGTSARYVGMGTVDGTVAGSWSMDEHDGMLRVATTTTGMAPETSVIVLRPEAGRLLDVGRVGGLGVGQQLRSVRWFGDLAVLVTFQQVDPFYVVDLADPARPRVTGELHLPGWSSYLHPVGPHLVLGLGQAASAVVEPPPLPMEPGAPSAGDGVAGTVTASPAPGPKPEPKPDDAPTFPMIRPDHAKATLFDISNPAHPRALDTVTYRRAGTAMAGGQPHQVTWLPDRHVLVTVLSGDPPWGWGPQVGTPVPAAWLSVLTVRHGSLDNRLVAVPEATDVSAVRTLPLADGRVVLVAGDSVRFVTV